MILDKIYSKIQNEIKKEQPFNEELFNLRSEEKVEKDIVSIFEELKIFPSVLDVKVTFDKKEENNYNKSFRSIDETRTYKARWEVKFSINKIKPDDKD